MRRTLSFFLSIIFLLLSLYFGYLALEEELPYMEAEQTARRLAKTYTEDSSDGPVEGLDTDSALPGMEIDFEGLRAVNEDITGWIRIPGTQINYPVLKHPWDNSYYLYHSPERDNNILGSIYMYAEAAGDFTDSHTILFGHNMKSGQMFGELSNYAEKEFRDLHPYVFLYIPGESIQCTVYSAYSCAVDDETFSDGYTYGSEAFSHFIKHTQDMSYWQSDILPSGADAVITLSTCTDEGIASRRFVVNCILTAAGSARGQI